MENNYYSGLLRKNPNPTLGSHYNDFNKHFYYVIMTIVALCLPPSFNSLVDSWNDDRLLFTLSIIILLLALYRAYQALSLARIDYEHLSEKKYDSIIFSAVSLLLVSGGLILLLCYNIAYYFFAYSFISALASINFITLYYRIYKEKQGFDYVCEMRIQSINAIVFLFLTILFFLTGMIIYLNIPNAEIIYITSSVAICILLGINIYHSHVLTYYPKIILSNALDVIHSKNGEIIRIERAESNDMKRIAIDITNEFRYVFEYVFAEKRRKVLRNYIYILLTSSLGFGYWGHMRFYNVINDKRVKVGWIKIDTIHHCWIYTILEGLLLFIRFSYYLGLRNLYKVIRRAKSIADDQPKINNYTFVLSYIVIKEPYRQMKYGYTTINLLKEAFFNSHTNNINVKKLSLLVRPDNIASIALFRKSGFSEHYLVSEISSKGKIIFHYEKND